tara:strand:+ start:91 stop:375 length:285 start_codon:yes stop_codon:yes gene_type:complete
LPGGGPFTAGAVPKQQQQQQQQQQKPDKNMTEKQIKLIEKIKVLALDNYEEGGDIIIECLADSEILEYMSSIKEAKEFMEIKAMQRREIESTIW